MVEQHQQPVSEEGSRGRRYDGLIALFFLGAVLFHPLTMSIFDPKPAATLFGIPLLFFYLFAAWGGLITVLAIVVEGSHRAGAPTGKPTGKKPAQRGSS